MLPTHVTNTMGVREATISARYNRSCVSGVESPIVLGIESEAAKHKRWFPV